MSQRADNCGTIQSMLVKYPDNYKVVIDTFTDTIENQEWDTDDLMYILRSGKGINSTIDIYIEDFISSNYCYNIPDINKK